MHGGGNVVRETGIQGGTEHLDETAEPDRSTSWRDGIPVNGNDQRPGAYRALPDKHSDKLGNFGRKGHRLTRLDTEEMIQSSRIFGNFCDTLAHPRPEYRSIPEEATQ